MSSIISQDILDIQHLDFIDFELDLSVPQIIWAPNGVGKSSIFNFLKDKGLAHVSFAEFSNNRPSFIKESKKKLRIGLKIQDIEDLAQQKTLLLDNCSVPEKLKRFNLTTIGNIKKIFPNHSDCKSNIEKDLNDFQEGSARELSNQIEEHDALFFIENWQALKTAAKCEKDMIALKEAMIHEAVESIEKWLSSNEFVCPICGAKQERSIIDIIRKRKLNQTNIKDSLIFKYSKAHPNLNATEISKNVENLCAIAGNEKIANESGVLSYCLSGGDPQSIDSLQQIASEVQELSKKIEALTAIRDEFYNHLKKREGCIVDLFKVKFEIPESDIKFDDEDKELVISLQRDVSTYSTGEIDLMITLVNINEFWASDSETLVLDDPITSFDIANQHTVLFDLIDIVSSRSGEKSVVVFTHNTDCINIADSQFSNKFQYFGLDRWSDGLRMQPINLDRCRSPLRRYLCQSALIEFAGAPSNDRTRLHARYVEAATARECEAPDLHKIFHYDGPSGDVTFNDVYLSNDYLVSLIDAEDPNIIDKNSFVARCVDKEVLLIALRVWVEKQIHTQLVSDTGYSKLTERPLACKIDYAFPANGDTRWNGSPSVTRSYLMGKKVMLNQASHEQAQSIPFEYALSLSSYDIEKTIHDIKDHFER